MDSERLTQESLQNYMDAIAEWETALGDDHAGMEWLADCEYDDDMSVRDAIYEQVLEVVEYDPDSPRPWLPMAPTVMITCGGPNVWVSCIESGWVRITVVWGDSATHDQYSPNVADLIKEMVNPE